MAKLKEALLPGLTQSRVRHREQHLTGRHARWQRLLSGTGSQDGQLQGLPKVQGDTALPLAILVGGNNQLPLNYEYNMLLGIILFSIKKVSLQFFRAQGWVLVVGGTCPPLVHVLVCPGILTA